MGVGQLLDGYCGGAFELGAADYVRVEAVGADWVVVRAIGESAIPQLFVGDINELWRQYAR